MTSTLSAPPVPRTGWGTIAGVCSLAAGAVHAVAAGAHAEHRAAVLAFVLLAALQLGWGGVAVARPLPPAGLAVGALVGLSALAGWLLAKTVGLPIAGLDAVETVQTADALAAGLALCAVLAVGAAARRFSPVRAPAWSVGSVVAGVAVLGMITAGVHPHPATSGHGGTAAARPYDPKAPIDLGGTPGVTPAQQAAAENLVAVTLLRLPRWADAAKAERAGFRSIGDGSTGTEHLINDRFLVDGATLDPDRPESLVYDTRSGGRRLVAAMFVLRPGTPLSQVPDVGGPLVQWHTHEDLCFTPAGQVRGITDAQGRCAPGLVPAVDSPMVHVWIEPHRCGPFAALEGLAGGTLREGEERLCDSAHGSTTS